MACIMLPCGWEFVQFINLLFTAKVVVSTQTITSPPSAQKKQSLIYRKKWASTHTGTMKDGWKVIRKQFSAGFQFPCYPWWIAHLVSFATYVVITRVRWVFFYFFWVIVGSGYLKIKNSKNHLDPVLLFLGDLKNLPRFRSWKSIEGWLWDGGRGRVCD